jgi:hypothetical protein
MRMMKASAKMMIYRMYFMGGPDLLVDGSFEPGSECVQVPIGSGRD